MVLLLPELLRIRHWIDYITLVVAIYCIIIAVILSSMTSSNETEKTEETKRRITKKKAKKIEEESFVPLHIQQEIYHKRVRRVFIIIGIGGILVFCVGIWANSNGIELNLPPLDDVWLRLDFFFVMMYAVVVTIALIRKKMKKDNA